MGSKPSSVIHIIVIGLSGVGKTHFLDLFNYASDLSKRPTLGYYEAKWDKFHMVEYGGKTSWDYLFHDYDIIYMIINDDYTIEKLLEAKSAMLMMCHKLPGKPLVVIFKGTKKVREDILQLEQIAKERKVGISHLNLDEETWKEGVSRLFKWTEENL